MNDDVKDTLTPGPMVSFRTAQKLSSYLVRAKLYPLKRTVGFRKYREKGLEVWEKIQNSVNIRSSGTSATFKINHRLTCDDKYLVYLFTCKKCLKQYIGETTILYFFTLFLYYVYVYSSFTYVFVILHCLRHVIFLYGCIWNYTNIWDGVFFAKIVLGINCFCRKLHLRCLYRF